MITEGPGNNQSLKNKGSGTDIIEPKPQRSLPRWIWLGCVLFVIAAALHSADESIGGGDTWVALACGRYQLGDWPRGPVQQSDRSWQMRLLDKFAVHITWHDPFGARTRPYNPQNKEDVGWVNQNWLTHTLFYQMKTAWGENSIVVYKFVQAVLTALFTYWAARALGAHPLLSAGAAAFGILLSRSFVDLRPNVSSILFAAIMIMLLAYWKKGSSWALAGMFPVMVIWANVHGGFIYAIMIFVVLWVGFLLAMVVNQGWLDLLWNWVQALPSIPRVIVWILILPIMVALWTWHSSWPLVLRLLGFAAVAGWTLLAVSGLYKAFR